MNGESTSLCLCHSGKPYAECCQRWHKNPRGASAREIMRSRFCAYARHDAAFIVKTTAKKSPAAQKDERAWKQSIAEFCLETRFVGLHVVDASEQGAMASVQFVATVEQRGHRLLLQEKSLFWRRNGVWLYAAGDAVVTPAGA